MGHSSTQAASIANNSNPRAPHPACSRRSVLSQPFRSTAAPSRTTGSNSLAIA